MRLITRLLSNSLLYWILVLAACAAFSVAHAAQATVTDDSYTSQTRPAAQQGTVAQITVDSADHAFLKFDLSSLPSGTPASQIARATLLLRVNRVTAPGLIDVAPVIADWNESTLTFNNEPGSGPPAPIPTSIAATSVRT